ncbi:MAG: cupin domain-containing protein [Armatimonadota bacterium]
MFIKKLKDCTEIISGDNVLLREMLHPDKEELSLRYSLAHAVLRKGAESLPHRMAASEVYYILEGRAVMHIDNEEREVAAGDTVYIPPGSVQYIKNTGSSDLKFLCMVDPAWKKEEEEIISSHI